MLHSVPCDQWYILRNSRATENFRKFLQRIQGVDRFSPRIMRQECPIINIFHHFSSRKSIRNFRQKHDWSTEKKKSKAFIIGKELFQRLQILLQIVCFVSHLNFLIRFYQLWKLRTSICQKMHNMIYILFLNKSEGVVKIVQVWR